MIIVPFLDSDFSAGIVKRDRILFRIAVNAKASVVFEGGKAEPIVNGKHAAHCIKLNCIILELL